MSTKRYIVSICAIGLFIIIAWTAAFLFINRACGQHPLQKPGSSVVELSPIVVIPTAPSATTAPNPLGTMVRLGARSVLVLKITSAPSGGSGQSLDIYFQHNSDNRQTWSDFAEVHATAVGTYYLPISAIVAGSASVSAMNDGSLGINSTVQGPLGNILRTKFNANMGTGNSGMWSYQAFVLPD